MPLSRYIKIFSYPEKPGHFILYSTKKASSILVDESTLESIKKEDLASSDKKLLSRLGFLVADLNKEKKEILSLFDRANKRINNFKAIVVMNLTCNLACKYCYEKATKGNYYLSSEMADQLILYLEKRYLSKGKEVHLDFYGGEPLLSIDLIKYISRKLKSSAEKKGLSYSFNLITNGTLLTGKMAKELVLLGLQGAKISIDGPRENHDHYRPFVSGHGSFNVIIKNIKEVSDIIKLQLDGNYTQENYRDFPGLLDEFLENDLTPDKISGIKFAPVTRVRDDAGSPNCLMGCASTDEPWLFEASLFLREEILKRGFNTPKLTPSSCMIDFNHNLVINFDGSIYKCPGFIGWKEFEAGHLNKGLIDYRQLYQLDLWKRQECLECEYLPLCFGGCRYLKVVRDGKIDGVDCKKIYLDATLERAIRQEIKYKPKG